MKCCVCIGKMVNHAARYFYQRICGNKMHNMTEPRTLGWQESGGHRWYRCRRRNADKSTDRPIRRTPPHDGKCTMNAINAHNYATIYIYEDSGTSNGGEEAAKRRK